MLLITNKKLEIIRKKSLVSRFDSDNRGEVMSKTRHMSVTIVNVRARIRTTHKTIQWWKKCTGVTDVGLRVCAFSSLTVRGKM